MKGFLAIGFGLTLILILICGLVVFGTGYYLSPQDDLKKSQAVIAISGGETDSRMNEAVKLYKEGWAAKIIFSGAALDPNSPSNALAMKRRAIAMGVPAQAIIIEEKSVNTRQNAQFVRRIIEPAGYTRIILVTSPYHQRRASLTFQQEMPDLEIIDHSAKDHRWRRSRWWDSPSSLALTLAELQKTIFLILGGRPA